MSQHHRLRHRKIQRLSQGHTWRINRNRWYLPSHYLMPVPICKFLCSDFKYRWLMPSFYACWKESMCQIWVQKYHILIQIYAIKWDHASRACKFIALSVPKHLKELFLEYLYDFHFTTSQVEHNIPLIAHSNTQHRKWGTISKDGAKNEKRFKPRNRVVLQQKAWSRIPIYSFLLTWNTVMKICLIFCLRQSREFQLQSFIPGSVKCPEGQSPRAYTSVQQYPSGSPNRRSLLGQTEGKKLLTV